MEGSMRLCLRRENELSVESPQFNFCLLRAQRKDLSLLQIFLFGHDHLTSVTSSKPKRTLKYNTMRILRPKDKENVRFHPPGGGCGISRAVPAATDTQDEDKDKDEDHDVAAASYNGKATTTTTPQPQIIDFDTEFEIVEDLFARLYPLPDEENGSNYDQQNQEKEFAVKLTQDNGKSAADNHSDTEDENNSLLNYLEELTGGVFAGEEWDEEDDGDENLDDDFDYFEFDLNDIDSSLDSDTNSNFDDILISTKDIEQFLDRIDIVEDVLNSNSTCDDNNTGTSSIPAEVERTFIVEEMNSNSTHDISLSSIPISQLIGKPLESRVEATAMENFQQTAEPEISSTTIPLIDLCDDNANDQTNRDPALMTFHAEADIPSIPLPKPVPNSYVYTMPMPMPVLSNQHQQLQAAINARLIKMKRLRPKGNCYLPNKYETRLSRKMIMLAGRKLRGKVITIKWRSKKGIKLREVSDEKSHSQCQNWGDYTPKKNCTFCGKQYSFYYYPKHLQNAHYDGVNRESSDWLGCPICHVMCKNRKARTMHMVQAHSEEQLTCRFSCDNCPRLFKDMAGIRAHMESEHPTHIITCPFGDGCDKKFPSGRTLLTHLRVEHKLKFRCKICKLPFPTRVEVKEHYESCREICNSRLGKKSRKRGIDKENKSKSRRSKSNSKPKHRPRKLENKNGNRKMGTPGMSLNSYINQFLFDDLCKLC